VPIWGKFLESLGEQALSRDAAPFVPPKNQRPLFTGLFFRQSGIRGRGEMPAHLQPARTTPEISRPRPTGIFHWYTDHTLPITARSKSGDNNQVRNPGRPTKLGRTRMAFTNWPAVPTQSPRQTEWLQNSWKAQSSLTRLSKGWEDLRFVPARDATSRSIFWLRRFQH